jgi:SAM-dependent methyltransferase
VGQFSKLPIEAVFLFTGEERKGLVENGADSRIQFACPRCRGKLEAGEGTYHCPEDGLVFERRQGVWRFLLPERAVALAEFIEQYETVRADEGWGSDDGRYYRALPYADLSGWYADIWRIRAASFDSLMAEVVKPQADELARPLRILDLGAGNGWLSYRLAQAGHAPVAVDLISSRRDGLGAHVHYDVAFTPVQAEYDRLPFQAGSVDLLIYNASLHYAPDFLATLAEGLKALAPGGRLAIMDSPLYRDRASGEAMVRERAERFDRQYGFRGEANPSEGYLSYDRLESLAAGLGLQWSFIEPAYGWRWALRSWLARLRAGREAATFLVIVGRPQFDTDQHE